MGKRDAGYKARRRKRGESQEAYQKRLARLEKDRLRKQRKRAHKPAPPYVPEHDPAGASHLAMSLAEWAEKSRRWQQAIRDDWEKQFADPPPAFGSLIGYDGDVDPAAGEGPAATPSTPPKTSPESGAEFAESDQPAAGMESLLSSSSKYSNLGEEEPAFASDGRRGASGGSPPLKGGGSPLTPPPDLGADSATHPGSLDSYLTPRAEPGSACGIDPSEAPLEAENSGSDYVADPAAQRGGVRRETSPQPSPAVAPPSPADAAVMVFLTSWLFAARALQPRGPIRLRFGARQRWQLARFAEALPDLYERIAGVIAAASVDLIAVGAAGLINRLDHHHCPRRPALAGSAHPAQIRALYERRVAPELAAGSLIVIDPEARPSPWPPRPSRPSGSTLH